MEILERIKELCAERGWTLYELSKRANISEATVYTWNSRKKCPSIPALQKICAAFGINLFQFFEGLCPDELTEEQKEILIKWSKLTEAEKRSLTEVLDTFIALNTRR